MAKSDAERAKKYYGRNRDRILQQKKEYLQKNRDRINWRRKEYRQKNLGVTSQRNKDYYSTIRGYLKHSFGNMKRRCDNPKVHNYSRYGGRGIEVRFVSSDELVSHVVDELQVDPRGLQIDRIDNDGHYERGNIRFVAVKENCGNRSNSKVVVA